MKINLIKILLFFINYKFNFTTYEILLAQKANLNFTIILINKIKTLYKKLSLNIKFIL